MSVHNVSEELRLCDFPATGKAMNTPDGYLLGWGPTAALATETTGYASAAKFIDTTTGTWYNNRGGTTTAAVWAEDVTLSTVGGSGTEPLIVKLVDNSAAALNIKEGSNNYLTFVSTNSSEGITVGQNLTMANGKNIVVNATTGTKIGTAVSQKLGFWNATPVVQPASANQAALTLDVDVTGADTVDKAAINANFTAIQTLVNQLRADLVTAGLIKGAA